MGQSSTHPRVSGSIPNSSWLHVKVPLDKTLKPCSSADISMANIKSVCQFNSLPLFIFLTPTFYCKFTCASEMSFRIRDAFLARPAQALIHLLSPVSLITKHLIACRRHVPEGESYPFSMQRWMLCQALCFRAQHSVDSICWLMA